MISLKERIRLIEKEEIFFALMECSWVKAGAAKMLGITGRMIGYKIKIYGIKMKEVTYGEADVSGTDAIERNIRS